MASYDVGRSVWCGRAGGLVLVFCNAISALRRLVALLKILKLPVEAGALHSSTFQLNLSRF